MHRSGTLRRAVALLALTGRVAACTGGGEKDSASSIAPALDGKYLVVRCRC